MDDLTKLLSDLVAIPSVNPSCTGPGDPAAGEEKLARFAAEYARKAGLQARLQAVEPHRPNFIARLPGARPGRRLIFLTHLDTVGSAGMAVPAFRPTLKGGDLYGRGSCDPKASFAAMLFALRSLAAGKERPQAEVLVVATAGEERNFVGVRKFIDSGIRADGCIVGEPTSLRLVVAHKGLVRWRIRTVGKTAHSSMPQKGINAVYRMAPIVSAIEEYATTLDRRRHPLLGSPTISIGRIEGGTAVNVVPDSCSIEIDMRLLPGMKGEAAMKNVAGYLRKRGIRTFVAEKPFLVDFALDQEADHPLVTLVQRAARAHGADCPIVGAAYGTDGSKMHRASIPTVVLGPGESALAHTPSEHVSLEETARAARIYEQIAREF